MKWKVECQLKSIGNGNTGNSRCFFLSHDPIVFKHHVKCVFRVHVFALIVYHRMSTLDRIFTLFSLFCFGLCAVATTSIPRSIIINSTPKSTFNWLEWCACALVFVCSTRLKWAKLPGTKFSKMTRHVSAQHHRRRWCLCSQNVVFVANMYCRHIVTIQSHILHKNYSYAIRMCWTVRCRVDSSLCACVFFQVTLLGIFAMS